MYLRIMQSFPCHVCCAMGSTHGFGHLTRPRGYSSSCTDCRDVMSLRDHSSQLFAFNDSSRLAGQDWTPAMLFSRMTKLSYGSGGGKGGTWSRYMHRIVWCVRFEIFLEWIWQKLELSSIVAMRVRHVWGSVSPPWR